VKLWKKLEVVENPPAFIDGEDECYYARDYIARGTHKDSEANQLISNFKRHPKFRGQPPWRYKQRAIDQFAAELGGIIGKNLSVAAVPSSKLPDHPEYDSRLLDTLGVLKRLRPDLVIETPLALKASTKPSHHGGSRSINEISFNLEWRGLSGACRLLILVDDVLTSGAHFKACKQVITAHAPDVRVAGIFWARTVWPEAQPPFEDLTK